MTILALKLKFSRGVRTGPVHIGNERRGRLRRGSPVAQGGSDQGIEHFGVERLAEQEHFVHGIGLVGGVRRAIAGEDDDPYAGPLLFQLGQEGEPVAIAKLQS